jgi:8-oxo-dGTP diphosphatase
MARVPVLAAGGIVVRQGVEPLIAVVRLRKRDDWVLPKGKLNAGETAREAAAREVLEETGHRVEVHEFLGTLAYESGGRTKIVDFWRMEPEAAPSGQLMKDVTAVDWLPLDAAIARLSRVYERAFLGHVGPMAMQASPSMAPPLDLADRRRPMIAPDRGAAGPWPDPRGNARTLSRFEGATKIADAPALAPEIDSSAERVAPPPASLMRKLWRWLISRFDRV